MSNGRARIETRGGAGARLGEVGRRPTFGAATKAAVIGLTTMSLGLVAAQAPAFAEPSATPTPKATVPLPQNSTGAPRSVSSTPAAAPSTQRELPQAPVPTSLVPTKPIEHMKVEYCRYFEWNSSVDNVPRDPWHLQRLQMEEVWRLATGKGIKIAVIDTGVSTAGTEYLPPERIKTLNVIHDNDKDIKEGYDCEHGTNVAALIGAKPVPGMPSNFSGIAPESEIHAIRALHSSTDTQPYDETVAAIREAIKIPGIRIINISQAGDYDRADYAAAIQEALAQGIIVVAAAGNRGALEGAAAAYPASYPGVIAVGMTAPDDSPAPNSYFSPYQKVTVGAPGVQMVSISPSDFHDWNPQRPDYDRQIYRFGSVGTASGGNEFSGTSFAAPVVTGVIALMLEVADAQGVRLSPDDVARILRDTADPPASSAPDPQIGWGIVNPLRALAGVQAAAPSTPPSRDSEGTEYPNVHYVDEKARMAALITGGVLAAGVALGLGARTAIPAARRRGGRAAAPGEQFVDREDEN